MKETTNLHKKAELAANIAIVVVAVLVCIVLVRNYVIDKGERPVPIEEVAAGMKLTVSNLDWSNNGQTLLLAISKGCHFCSESAPFYKKIVEQLAGRADIRLVAVFPRDVEEGKQYLSELGLAAIGEVRQVSFNSIKVAGTPTLILVDSEGVVTGVWTGKLPPDEEATVLSRLKSQSASR